VSERSKGQDAARVYQRAIQALYTEALSSGCCGNDQWRGRLCTYHQGVEDGIEIGIRETQMEAS